MITMPPAAEAQQNQAGLVNLAIGDIVIRDIGIGVAAQVIAAVCPAVDVGNVAVLAAQASRDGSAVAVCESQQGDQTLPVTISR
jgi:hypothetical protein